MSENPASMDTPKSSSTTSEADADHAGGTQSPDDATLGGISDEQLPEDLQPGEDNPLAEPLDPDAEETKSREELGMDDTQEDLGNPPVGDSDGESAGESAGESDAGGSDANEGDGAEGAGIAGG